MKIAVLGTGVVGQTIGSKLVALGHEVKMGSRSATNEKAVGWAKGTGGKGSPGTFAEAAAFGELVFLCAEGRVALEVLTAAGARSLAGKVVVDVSNPLDFSKGMPPTLFAGNTESLSEQLQRAFPEAKFVKSLNTMTASLMVDPSRLKGEHDVFVSGNDAEAKSRVTELLKSFGWKNILDLGDLTTARGTEQLLPIWLRLWGVFKSPEFNFHITR